ncbi:glycosyltransferase [Nocardioides sp.]|uniref:glycosyltransferase n=1 Tax=Nocardioides sp. TaxID=35761 RepID=UPI001A1F7A57|nr:glycosyltransferase [Nocardioides sp.]MBJ7359479.1 glycosyltransferase [Nocardioides sp.]
MTSRPKQAARRALRAIAATADDGGAQDVAPKLKAIRKRQRLMAVRMQARLEALATETRARHAELAAQVNTTAALAATPPPGHDQSDLVRRIWLHEEWLRAVPPAGVPVSVVVPTRHRPEFLRRALRSLVAQTYPEWEGLVVDDGDPDRTHEVRAVLDELADPRLRLVPSHGGNEGAARNAGLAAASGELVTYLDDDNVMFPVWLAALVDAARRHPEAPLLYGARVARDAAGNERVHLDDFDRRLLEQHNLVDTGQIGHRADPAVRWDPDLPRFSDWDLVLRLTDDDPGVPVPARAVGYTTDAPDRISDGRDIDGPAARVRASARRRRPLHVLGVNAQFPLLSETYIADELGALAAHGARLGFVRIKKPVAPMRVDAPVWGDLATGVREFAPDVIVMHWVGVAHMLADQLTELGIPYAVRSHGFDIDRGAVERVLADPLCLGVWAYPTASQGFPGTHALPLLLTSHERIPAPDPSRTRDLVLSSSAGLPKKDFDLLFAAMDQLPGVERRIVVAATEEFEQLPGDLFERCGDRTDPPLVQVNLPREDVFALLGRTALHVYTLRPDDPFGMPMSVAEALCAGASVCLPDRPEARAYAGPGARFYTTAEDIARHAREVLANTPEVQEERAANRRWALERFCDPAAAERFNEELRAALARHRGEVVLPQVPAPARNGASRGTADLVS